MQAPRSLTRFSWLILDSEAISDRNSLSPCFDSADSTFTATNFPSSNFPFNFYKQISLTHKEFASKNELYQNLSSSKSYLINRAKSTFTNFVQWIKAIGSNLQFTIWEAMDILKSMFTSCNYNTINNTTRIKYKLYTSRNFRPKASIHLEIEKFLQYVASSIREQLITHDSKLFLNKKEIREILEPITTLYIYLLWHHDLKMKLPYSLFLFCKKRTKKKKSIWVKTLA